MPTRQTDKTQNKSHLPHNSPRIFVGRMDSTPMNHDILLPGASAPESLSGHADHATHAVTDAEHPRLSSLALEARLGPTSATALRSAQHGRW